MPEHTKKLRIAFVAVAALLLATVIGFYAYARYRVRVAIKEVPKALGLNVQQLANGFKVSKSEGGRMLFSISAASAVQYKGNQKAQLKDARIIVYNRGKGTNDPATDVYDQIYGKEFDYDHKTGEVKAEGDVLIDLQGKGAPPDDPAKTTASPGALHLKTSGLTFNEKTGIAETNNVIEFALPQGSGSAKGAVYDSKLMSVHLKSDVKLRTSGTSSKRGNATPATITAANADIFDLPREAILSDVHVEDEQQTRSMNTGRMTIILRDDNTIERITANGGVNGWISEKAGAVTQMQAQQSELMFGAANDLKTALLTGAVKLDSRGGPKGDLRASAGRAELEFAAKTQLKKVHATQQVTLASAGGKQDAFALNSPAVDFFVKPGNRLDRAVTSGASEIVLDSKPGAAGKAGGHTVATADKFEATFASGAGAKSSVQSVRGTGNTKVVSASAGNADRVTTGQDLLVKFDPKSGAVASVEQKGDFKYAEGPRNASAEQAQLDMTADQLTLNGSPRVQDLSQGFTLTAKTIKMTRKSGDINADGEVKATYNQIKAGTNQSGAMFSGQSGEPVHATSQAMTASKATGIAKFIGKARLWQGANLVEAPQISFDKDKRSLTAEGANGPGQVQTAFVQTDKKGKVTPVSVAAGRLVYSDNDHKARFEGGLRLKTAEMTMVADHADVFLKTKPAQASGTKATGGSKDSASQIDRIEAAGDIVIEEQEPVRKVTGSRLVYTADDGKFVMTGEPGKSPSIFDAERGNLTGDSLTFYTRDDRVQVGSGENARVVTRTRIKDERKP